MAGVLDLAKIFQFVEDCFNQGTPAQNGFLELGAGYGFHVFLERGDELKVLLGQCLSEPMGNVPLIGEQLTEHSLAEIRYGLTVIHITRSELEANQLTLGVDNGVELESIEPAH